VGDRRQLDRRGHQRPRHPGRGHAARRRQELHRRRQRPRHPGRDHARREEAGARGGVHQPALGRQVRARRELRGVGRPPRRRLGGGQRAVERADRPGQARGRAPRAALRARRAQRQAQEPRRRPRHRHAGDVHPRRRGLRAEAQLRRRADRRAARDQELPAPRPRDDLHRRDRQERRRPARGGDPPLRPRQGHRRVAADPGHGPRQAAGAVDRRRVLPREEGRRGQAGRRAGAAVDRGHRRADQAATSTACRRPDGGTHEPACARRSSRPSATTSTTHSLAQGRDADRRGHPRGRRRVLSTFVARPAVPGPDQGPPQQPRGAGQVDGDGAAGARELAQHNIQRRGDGRAHR
jgi:hypothetical protein